MVGTLATTLMRRSRVISTKGSLGYSTEANREFENNYTLRERFRIDSKGKRSYSHRLNKTFSEDGARIGGEFTAT